MTHLLDTDHISILQHRTGREYPAVQRHVAGHRRSDIGYPIVSFHEQSRGAHDYISRARTAAELLRGYELLETVRDTFAAVPVAAFDPAALVEFDRLRGLRVRIGTLDLRIAAIARSRNLIVVTRNTVDFGRVPGLVTEDWTK